MKIGTVDPIDDRDKVLKRRPRSRFFGGRIGKSGGGNNGGENNGGDGSKPESYSDTEPPPPDKAKFVTYFLLLVVLMTFGGLLGAYVVISTNGAAEWRPFDLPVQVWISTALILISSVTYQIAKNALFVNKFQLSRKMLIATTALGATFISSQILVWLALVNRGLYMSGNPYAGFFYILTAAHAVHVLGGIVALGAVLLRNWNETEFGPELLYRRNLARSVGWYWHFMGGLWIVLLVMLGFWK